MENFNLAVLLVLLGMVGFILSGIGLIKGNLSFMKIHSRKQAGLFLTSFFVLLIIGGVVLPSAEESADSASSNNQVSAEEDQKINKEEGNQNKTISHNEMQVHFIDVGQGEAILIQSPNGSTMLIDAGKRTSGQKVVSYLKKAGVTTLDKLVSTHPHADHIGGMQDVFANFKVGKVYDSGFPHSSKTYEDFLTTIDKKDIPFEIAKRGMKIDLDKDLDVEILHPNNNKKDANNSSVVIKLTYGSVSFLFTGDIEGEAEREILGSNKGKLNSTILKAGHHGSKTSTSTGFLSAVSPETAVIQSGAGNSYGHPHDETLSQLKNLGVKVYRNDLQGDIVVTTNGSSHSVNVKPTHISDATGSPSSGETSMKDQIKV